MKRILITDCLEKIGEEVKLVGFVQTIRKHGKIAFCDIVDRSGLLQAVGLTQETAEQIGALHTQDAVLVTGVVQKRQESFINPNLPTGGMELHVEKITVIAKSDEMPFDMAGKQLHLELPTLLDYRSLTLRHPTVSSIFKVEAAVIDSFRNTAKKLDCTEIFVPTIAASATEGGAEVFSIDYYEHKAYLTQSPQLYKQMLVPVFERVYTIAHAYRAEPSVTTRHLAEVVQMDCEFGFVDFAELLDLLEHTAKEMIGNAAEVCKEIIAAHRAEMPKVSAKVPRLTLTEAQEIIHQKFGRDVRGEKDLSPQDELDLWTWGVENYKSDLVIVTHFPTLKRAFYTMPDPKDEVYSLSYDILFKGLEIASGSQRIHDYQKLVHAIEKRGMDPKAFELYLQAFQYGMPEEGGFSFGLERIVMKLLKLQNIRQASLYPRDMERVDERLSVLDQKT